VERAYSFLNWDAASWSETSRLPSETQSRRSALQNSALGRSCLHSSTTRREVVHAGTPKIEIGWVQTIRKVTTNDEPPKLEIELSVVLGDKIHPQTMLFTSNVLHFNTGFEPACLDASLTCPGKELKSQQESANALRGSQCLGQALLWIH
jgi:hypothetical protein